MRNELQTVVWKLYNSVSGLKTIEFRYTDKNEDPTGKECVYEVVFLSAHTMQAGRKGNILSYYER